MRYLELTATVAAADAAAAACVLGPITESGVSIEQPFTQPDLDSGARVTLDGFARVRIYLPQDDRNESSERQTRSVLDSLIRAGIDAAVSERVVDEEDWAESWKDHWQIERFGERIVVVPSWRTFDAAPRDVVLRLDPGMAFGTGQHETTRLCLEALERVVRPGERVLDAGCGSGILAIAAAKLGAREVYAVDIDHDAARVATANACTNGVADRVRVAHGSLRSDAAPDAPGRWPFDDPPHGQFDVVVANIIASVVVELARDLGHALAPAGKLIVSGVIAQREPEVAAALVAAGVRIGPVRAMGDWRCIEASLA